ncbi:hypothetical protein NEUTE1DRAFT_99650 [Neurospora tetrasperma FGSC 2508]|uniref:Uncharacterized protein n=1 Tax=Neurospora tetrasperma (strain FGSC 2508 / ATCC MYA-4615 / P0657) TaxID=510951 RepID=F8MGR3_NEUT8|nr:uncharacterized protein NEUTE1DRAFT_99650 [Neurospora tetrasperma FGSC 2508]EGO59482.1 hypothetical protein NEUTE1DRAFT_99650 [Neurospora tetrasperma FGSC 2508]
MSDKPSTGTKAEMSSGSGTSTGPSTGAAASDTRDKPVATKPAQTCDCGHTGSCTCTPGDCACENCPKSGRLSKLSPLLRRGFR